MNILKIAEVLESYSEDVLAYKLDGDFANAVTEAVRLLISQGEQIADLENKLATVDAVEVVRCKDCQHCDMYQTEVDHSFIPIFMFHSFEVVDANGFCYRGERKSDATD